MRMQIIGIVVSGEAYRVRKKTLGDFIGVFVNEIKVFDIAETDFDMLHLLTAGVAGEHQA